MKLIDYLEKDRDRIMAGLRSASTPADAQQLLEKETDRLLLQYNEDCTSIRVRDAASGMMQALRSSVPMLDTMGEPRVWKSEGGSGGRDGSGTGRRSGAGLSGILLGIGAVLTLAAFALPALAAGGTAALGTLMKGILFPLAGGACLYFAGRTAGRDTRISFGTGRTAGGDIYTQRVEITIDPDKLWNSLRGAVMVIDRNLETARESEAYDRRKELAAAGGARGISAAEIDLFSGLLETADAESPQMAADIRYYLHTKNVDVLPWSQQNAAWFEILPAVPGLRDSREEDGVITIRPALAQDGKLLRKGTAVR